MRLAPLLALAFGFVATLSVAGLGLVVREDRRQSETKRFEQEVSSACDRVVAELERQGERDQKLLAGACKAGELVDRALVWLEAGPLDDSKRLALSRLVPEERQAFDLDSLMLATESGDVLGQDPLPHVPLARLEVARRVAVDDPLHFAVRSSAPPALLSRCRRPGTGGTAVALLATRDLAPLVDRLGKTVAATVSLGTSAPPTAADAAAAAADGSVVRATCALKGAAGASLPIVVVKPKRELLDNLARIDQTIFYAGLASTGIALVLGVLLARRLGRPIAELAVEAGKVVSGEARPLRVRGTSEIAELVGAFDAMLVDLEATRRRLDATSRIAAWREVARRVAHEVKNPLAPIQAAVETLRRLRARDDPEFFAYFDEATRTVLDEVHRISNIVTEFTRFARLPAPRPQPVDLVEAATQVVQLYGGRAGAETVDVKVVVERTVPPVLADRDQIVQVLTNLVQNALDAAKDVAGGGQVRVTIAAAPPRHVRVTVSDNGPGVPKDLVPRLFEPYMTTKQAGTGLGLAIAQRIAIEHGGELSYVPAPSGASFELRLPVEGPPEGEREGEPPSREGAKR